MSVKLNIKGKIVYHDIGTGVWGILSTTGDKYMPVNLPDSWKEVDKEVDVSATEVEGFHSMFMWGTAIELII